MKTYRTNNLQFDLDIRCNVSTATFIATSCCFRGCAHSGGKSKQIIWAQYFKHISTRFIRVDWIFPRFWNSQIMEESYPLDKSCRIVFEILDHAFIFLSQNSLIFLYFHFGRFFKLFLVFGSYFVMLDQTMAGLAQKAVHHTPRSGPLDQNQS